MWEHMVSQNFYIDFELIVNQIYRLLENKFRYRNQ